jgi:hypothetical protein
MFAQHRRSALLAGLLTAVLVAPAWSADDVATKPETDGTQQAAATVASPPPQAGPVVARESLATEASARAAVVVGENQPTRSSGTPKVGKRYAGTRASVAYNRPVYRYSLMLGIGF